MDRPPSEGKAKRQAAPQEPSRKCSADGCGHHVPGRAVLQGQVNMDKCKSAARAVPPEPRKDHRARDGKCLNGAIASDERASYRFAEDKLASRLVVCLVVCLGTHYLLNEPLISVSGVDLRHCVGRHKIGHFVAWPMLFEEIRPAIIKKR